MNEFKMSLFLAPISPVKDGGTGQIIKPATLKPYKTMTLQEVYRTITANTRLQLLTDRVRRAFDSGDLSAYRALKQELLPYVTPCGTFARRRSDSLLEASGLVVVDIDHLDSADEAARLRRQLFEGVDTSGKDLVRACFLSYDPGALIATRNNLSPENNLLQNQ